MEEPLYDDTADTRALDEALAAAEGAGPARKAWLYTKLSGPGWLQGAITLGGGSLAGALYLGVVGGYDTLWVQPLAMILGVVMLAAIGYVALSTGQRPLVSVNTRISPVLGWAWLLAVLVANHVWCLPQYSLAEAAVQQNLLPSLRYNGTGLDWAWVVGLVTFGFTATIVVFYDAGSKGVRVVEAVLKAMVGLIVLAFIAVVVVLAIRGALPLGKIFAGLIPTLSSATQPTADLQTLIDRTGPAAAFWTSRVAAQQRDIVIGAFGVAVGINMTFLLPYSLLKKGWTRRHRGLAIYDLSIGLVVPFFLATTCLVIASASQFHARSNDVLDAAGKPKPAAAGSYYGALTARAAAVPPSGWEGKFIPQSVAVGQPFRPLGATNAELDTLPAADHAVAAALVSRDADNLATTLEPLVGKAVAQYVFGLGVLGMAVSTIIVLMLMNSFAVSEALGMPNNRTVRLIGAMMPGVLGLFAPAIWSGQTKAALAIPANVIGGSLIPIAYFTFFLMMNSKKLLGSARPTGTTRFVTNALMLLSTTVATVGCVWGLLARGTWGYAGVALLAILFVWGLVEFLYRERRIEPTPVERRRGFAVEPAAAAGEAR